MLSCLWGSTYKRPLAAIWKDFLICLCNFELSCPIFEKDNFTENLYIVLLNSVLFLTLFVSTYLLLIVKIH